MAITANRVSPSLECANCGAKFPLSGQRIGDSTVCPSCNHKQVVLRSRTLGDVPPAEQAGSLRAAERAEVDEVLRRIKLRRVGRANQHVELYPTWAVFVGGVQFYLAAIMAGQNLIAIGEERRGKRIMITGVVLYLLLGAGLFGLTFFSGELFQGSSLVMLGVAALIPLVFAIVFTNAQHASCSAAREAGAKDASVVLPLLLGLILAITQAFAVWFVKLQMDPFAWAG